MSKELSGAGDFFSWVKKQLELNKQASHAKNLQVRRGEVYWCEFGLNIGSEMSKAGPRPAVIVQNNPGNHSSPNTVVVPVTHDSGTQYFLVPITTQRNPDGSVLLDGQVNVSNIVCVSKARLTKRITQLPNAEMRKIDGALARLLSIAAAQPNGPQNAP